MYAFANRDVGPRPSDASPAPKVPKAHNKTGKTWINFVFVVLCRLCYSSKTRLGAAASECYPCRSVAFDHPNTRTLGVGAR